MRAKNTFYRLLLSAVVVFSLLLTACDDHERIDHSYHVGYILCNDGQVMSEEAYFAQSHLQAVAIVFSELLDDGRYLAVLLDETPPLLYCDTLFLEQGTSKSKSALDGYANTTAMQNNVSNKGFGSPLADYVFNRHTYGQSDFVPSVGELRLLYANRQVVNRVMSRINEVEDDRCTLLSFEGENCWYWSSTEVDGNSGRQAWLFSMSSGAVHETPKSLRPYKARVVVNYYPDINK